MSNIFKTNSRFAGLIDKPENGKSSVSAKMMKNMGWKDGEGLGKNKDGIKKTIEIEKNIGNSGIGLKVDDKKFNSFKDTGYRERRQNRYPSESEKLRMKEEYEAEEKAMRELKKREEERIKMESLKIEFFPELSNTNNTNNKNTKVLQEDTYIEKLKKIEETKNDSSVEDPELDNLENGWLLIKKDKITGKKIIKGKVREIISNRLYDKEIASKVVERLTRLYDERTDEFIDLNGYDTWEELFKYPNWREREIELDNYYMSDEEIDEEDDEYEEE